MTLKFTLIYRTSNFAESKALDFDTRNVFKKHKLHAQYMTQRKMKVLAKADAFYNSILPVHQTLAHATFVIFVMPTEEATYKTITEINNLITELKKETLIENEEFHFVALVYNGVCLSQEQLQKIIQFDQNNNSKTALEHTLKNPVAILNYILQKNIAPMAYNTNYIENNILTQVTLQKIYI